MNEQLGWNLIVNESVIKLEKVPPKAMVWMGIQEFQEKLDYCLLCGMLLFLSDLDDGEQFLLSEAVTLALTDTFAAYGIDTRIKWTNDIVLEGKKLCGILTEMGLENEINAEIDHLVDLKREIREVISAVKNLECQTLLELRYLCFKTWEQIAVQMNYSTKYVFDLHRTALKMIEVPETPY